MLQKSSIADTFRQSPDKERRNLLSSVGPISDAFVVSTEPVTALIGPVGSAKTTAAVKRALIETARMKPWMPDGTRRYVLTVWRPAFKQLWGALIPSWQKVLPPGLDGVKWTGSNPGGAVLNLRFRDEWSQKWGSDCEMVVRFSAFDLPMEADDLGGFEMTDACLDEIQTHVEQLRMVLSGRVGREPLEPVMGRPGRIFGVGNAPSKLHWSYRDFYETPPPGFKLYRQPSGLSPDAENIRNLGVGYYQRQIDQNRHNKFWIRRMVYNLPGPMGGVDLCVPDFDDDLHVSPAPLKVFPQIPVLIGFDGGLTPAAVISQVLPDGQIRFLDEVAFNRGSSPEMVRILKGKLAHPRYDGCEFLGICDPSMDAGDDTELKSDRKRLQEGLGFPVRAAPSNSLRARLDPLIEATQNNIIGRPGLLLDPACLALRRGFGETFRYNSLTKDNDRGSIAKTPDSHVCEAGCYVGMMSGTAQARKRVTDRKAERERQRNQARTQPKRYNPFQRGA